MFDKLILDQGTTVDLEPPPEAIKRHRRNTTCCALVRHVAVLPRARIPESSCSSAALQHSPCSFAPSPDAHEKIRKTISPLSLLFLSCQPRPDVRNQPPSPRRVLWLLQCSTCTMTWPLPSSRPLLKDLSTAACSISNSIRFQLENLLHLLMVGGSRLCASNSDHVLLLHSSEEWSNLAAKLSSRFRRFSDLQ